MIWYSIWYNAAVITNVNKGCGNSHMCLWQCALMCSFFMAYYNIQYICQQGRTKWLVPLDPFYYASTINRTQKPMPQKLQMVLISQQPN